MTVHFLSSWMKLILKVSHPSRINCPFFFLQWTYLLASLLVICGSVYCYFQTPSLRQSTYAPVILIGSGMSVMYVMALAFVTELIGEDTVSISLIMANSELLMNDVLESLLVIMLEFIKTIKTILLCFAVLLKKLYFFFPFLSYNMLEITVMWKHHNNSNSGWNKLYPENLELLFE